MSDTLTKDQVREAFLEVLNRVIIKVPDANELFRTHVLAPSLAEDAFIPVREHADGTHHLRVLGIINGILNTLKCAPIYAQYRTPLDYTGDLSDLPLYKFCTQDRVSPERLSQRALVGYFPLLDISSFVDNPCLSPNLKVHVYDGLKSDTGRFLDWVRARDADTNSVCMFPATEILMQALLKEDKYFSVFYPNKNLKTAVLEHISDPEQRLLLIGEFDAYVKSCMDVKMARIEMVKCVDVRLAVLNCLDALEQSYFMKQLNDFS